jgi:hypothetical protein
LYLQNLLNVLEAQILAPSVETIQNEFKMGMFQRICAY